MGFTSSLGNSTLFLTYFVYLDSTYPLLVDLEKLKFVKRRSDGTKEQFCILTRFLRLMGTLLGEV